MAVISVPKRSSVSVKLNAGTDPSTGSALLRSVSLSGVKPGAEGEKVLNVVDLLANVLAHPVTRVEQTEVRTLERDA